MKTAQAISGRERGTPPPPPVSKLRAWAAACRSKTLAAACAPVAVGTAAGARAAAQGGGWGAPGADGGLWAAAGVPGAAAVRWDFAACALLFALLVQITCNLSNDLGDFLRGADTPRRLGPARMAAAGALTPRELRGGAALCAAAAFAAGLPLAAALGWWLVPVGALCLLAAFAYTNGPFPLAYNGLGDAFVLVFFGFVAVLFSAYAQCGAFPPAAWVGALACGLPAVNILLVNNARDMETDAAAGKRTTVVRFGRAFARRLYAVNTLLALASPAAFLLWETCGAALHSANPEGSAAVFLPPLLPALLTAPPALWLVWKFWRVPAATPATYNPLLGKTALLLLFHSLLLTAAFLTLRGRGG